MPLYEYQCSACGARFEQLRRMADADRNLECPKCQSQEVGRTLSTFASPGAGSGAEAMAPCGAPASACGSCNRG